MMVRVILHGLFEELDSELERQAEADERRRKEAEAQRQRYLRAEELRKQEAELASVLDVVSRWENAQKIRRAVAAAATRSSRDGQSPPQGNLVEWAKHASGVADRIDPFHHVQDE